METQVSIFNSEAGFKALFKHATVGIIVVNASGVIILSNPCIENMLGYQTGELEGQMLSTLIPSDNMPTHTAHVSSYFKRPVNRPMGVGRNLKALKKSGEELYVEISLCHYTFDGEKLAVAFVTDISLKKEKEDELEKHKQELEHKIEERTLYLNEALEREKNLNEIKSRFVSLASHEFRTPLSTILSSASLISKYNTQPENEKIDRHTERIKNAVHNLTSILNDFLSLDKLEQGMVNIQEETFVLEDVFEEITDELETFLKTGQKIVFTQPAKHTITTDKKLLHHILTNLISNASKYSAEEKMIYVSNIINHETLEISVRDEGIGIPESDQQKLFGLFFRASNASGIKGTGLGLSIVAKYVSILKGEITFKSVQDEGSIFTVIIPIHIV